MPEALMIRLASNSPRRRELMALGDWAVSTFVPNLDETQLAGEVPADYVMRLAVAKARAAINAAAPPVSFVVGADTAVVDDNMVLGKPWDAEEARSMLRRLRGREHQVCTGLALLRTDTGDLLTDVCTTTVPMRDYSDAEIEMYVDSRDPMDKAGAYGIQHAGFHPVQSLAGCFASVMGMPLCHLLRLFYRLGLAPQKDLPLRCQEHLRYACPVSDAILRGEPVG